LERLGLEYSHERFSLRNRVERSFRYLKQRTKIFCNSISTWKTQSVEDCASAIAIIRNILTIMKTRGGVLPGRQDRETASI
jgi:transposase-like protein